MLLKRKKPTKSPQSLTDELNRAKKRFAVIGDRLEKLNEEAFNLEAHILWLTSEIRKEKETNLFLDSKQLYKMR